MTSFELILKNIIKTEATRTSAIAVRKYIISLLFEFDVVEINLTEMDLTPSVADEVIGILAQKLGVASFRNKIKICHANKTQMALIKHVIAQRVYGSIIK